MAINRVDITVANLAALAQVIVSELEDGANAWVTSEEEYYTLYKTSSAVPDGEIVIAPLPGSPIAGNATAKWIQLGTNPAWAMQPDWFIDEITGSDENTGDSALTPLKTHEELVRRIGNQIIDSNVTVHIMSDLSPTNPVRVVWTVGKNGLVAYNGEKPLQVLHTGTFTAVTPSNPATNTQLLLTDPTANWAGNALLNTALYFTRIRLLGGASVPGAIGYPTIETAPNQARSVEFTHPIVLPLPDFDNPFSITPAVGDPYVVETGLTFIAAFSVDLKTTGIDFSPNGGGKTVVVFMNLAFSNTNDFDSEPPVRSQAKNNSWLEFWACDLGHAVPVNATGADFRGCKHSGFVISITSQSSSIIITGLITQFYLASGGDDTTFCQGTLFDLGGLLFVNKTRVSLEIVGLFDTGIGIFLFPGATVHVSSAFSNPALYGSGHGTGILLFATSSLVWDSGFKPTIAGTDVDLLVGGVGTDWVGFGNNFSNSANFTTVSVLE